MFSRRKLTERQRAVLAAHFDREACALLGGLNAEDDGGGYVLPTRFGPLHVKPLGTWVALRFDDDSPELQDRMRGERDFGRFSLKWNFQSWSDHITVEDRIGELRARLESVL